MVANFEAKLNEYAHLLVEVGLNVQKGQIPRISSPVECAPLARLCAAAALDCGAKDVVMEWGDDFIARQRYLKADESVFAEFPSYTKAKFDWMVETLCRRKDPQGQRCRKGLLRRLSLSAQRNR